MVVLRVWSEKRRKEGKFFQKGGHIFPLSSPHLSPEKYIDTPPWRTITQRHIFLQFCHTSTFDDSSHVIFPPHYSLPSTKKKEEETTHARQQQHNGYRRGSSSVGNRGASEGLLIYFSPPTPLFSFGGWGRKYIGGG